MSTRAKILADFSGKTAVVTGASAGFGEATAKRLAAAGAKVIAVARRADRLQKLANENPNIVPLELDVTGDLKPLEDFVAKNTVDILINNAGLAWGNESIQDAPREKWERMIDVNVKALIAVTQTILPQMVARKSGDIVNVGSISAYQTYKGGVQYCASKFAVKALTEGWRQDLLGLGIRVIGIHPGSAETEFSLVRFNGDADKAHSVYSGMTPLSAEDVADSIVWTLACPEHVTIQSLVIMPTDQAAVGQIARKA